MSDEKNSEGDVGRKDAIAAVLLQVVRPSPDEGGCALQCRAGIAEGLRSSWSVDDALLLTDLPL